MRKNQYFGEFDQNIIDALLKLKMPIIGKNGKTFLLRDNARFESGLEHIAKKTHRLKVRDIESVPSILKHPKFEMQDPNNRNYRNYYGIRKSDNSEILLKIVTWPYKNNHNCELIITIFPTNAIKLNK